MNNFAEEKFPAEGIEQVLDEYFAETRLSEALTNLLITSYEIERRTPFFFKSHHAQRDSNHDFLMKDVGRATSAAPTYFEPAKIKLSGSSDYYALIDGGVFANNPAMCAYAEARDREVFPEGDDVLVVSLGTGVLTRRIPFDEANGWGLALWAQPLLGVIFDGVSSTVDYQLQQICRDRSGVSRYYRFQTVLSQGSDDLDDATNTNIRTLRLLGEDIANKQSRNLDQLCEVLVSEGLPTSSR